MRVAPKLKPLLANLGRLRIGEFLGTPDFQHLLLELDLDDEWYKALREIFGHDMKRVPDDLEESELENALALTLSYAYEYLDTFWDDIDNILIEFIKWRPVRTDLRKVNDELLILKMPKAQYKDFLGDVRRVWASKPQEVQSSNTSAFSSSAPRNKNVFIVHGHNENARLKLERFLKEDRGLHPIVMLEQPNDSVEHILSKFEKLADQCDMAIVLATADDQFGKTIFRARQNVVLELGYFLGKFHGQQPRRIVVVAEADSLELPSDMLGAIHLPFSGDIVTAFYQLGKQLDHWGY